MVPPPPPPFLRNDDDDDDVMEMTPVHRDLGDAEHDLKCRGYLGRAPGGRSAFDRAVVSAGSGG